MKTIEYSSHIHDKNEQYIVILLAKLFFSISGKWKYYQYLKKTHGQ